MRQARGEGGGMVAMAAGLWTRITITVAREATEAVIGILLTAGVGGAEIRDGAIWEAQSAVENRYGELLPISGPPHGETVEVVVHMPGDCRHAELIQTLQGQISVLGKMGLNPGPAKIETAIVIDSDWANSWKDYFHAQKIGKRIVIKPTWEPYSGSPEEVVVAMDPGMAFGTGEHETTRLCLVQLEELVRPGDIVYDIGCGSGILALAAAMLGASRVEACDIDPVAVRVAQENVAHNGLADRITVRLGSIDLLGGSADLIVANIISDVVIALLPAVQRRLAPKGRFVAGGIIDSRRNEVLAAHAAAGLRIQKEASGGDWVTLVSST